VIRRDVHSVKHRHCYHLMADSLTEPRLVCEIPVQNGPNGQKLGLIPICRNQSQNVETKVAILNIWFHEHWESIQQYGPLFLPAIELRFHGRKDRNLVTLLIALPRSVFSPWDQISLGCQKSIAGLHCTTGTGIYFLRYVYKNLRPSS
jgi:hypothetical protein